LRILSDLKKNIDPWLTLQSQTEDMIELMAFGDDLEEEFAEQIEAFGAELETLKKQLLFDGEFDANDAIIRITSGVGGLDAQDFAEMLERMYLRWAEKSDMKTTQIERSVGEEAGIKTTVFEVAGVNAYGKLRSENGVHRLVRISPFNSAGSRETSFALVEILPKIDAPEQVEIDEKDLRVDTYRAQGAGGQHVNKTESAIRLTHLPSGIVVACQQERSQHQNRATAMSMLKARLYERELQKREAEIDAFKGEKSEIGWGHQIRSYVLRPYQMIKDLRTGFENTNSQAVLDGDIDGFLEASLAAKVTNKRT
jgi:peptide chain release factor 2